MSTIKQIIHDYLEERGFTGLCNGDIPCGCSIDDLTPCDGDIASCEPAYKTKCKGEACEHLCDGYDEGGDCFTTVKPVRAGSHNV